MVLGKKKTLLFSLGLTMALLGGCGSGGTTNDDTGSVEQQTPDENTNENDDNDNNTTTDPIISGYTAGDGVLIETRSDGSKLAWVNSITTACLIYRIEQHPGTTILGGGTAHCEGLNHGGITTWRMPTEEEAVYVMANSPVNPTTTPNTDSEFIIYPSDNTNCQFMATATSGRFVYTTNSSSTGAFTELDRGTAGIRCVANQ